MAKEPDQTRWVGIRPTDPSENIPVTESAPLSSIEVEPKPGSANFPVTESAPLTNIQVEPKPGSANFPVTESAPLTSVKVSPLTGITTFKTLTEKRLPAIGDLQAIEDVIHLQDIFTVLVAGTNRREIYTVPADTICMSVCFSIMCSTTNPTLVLPYIKRGAVQIFLGSNTYNTAWTSRIFLVSCPAKENDIFGIEWIHTQIGDALYSSLVGYIVPQYT